jgi:hypothetical protein
MKLDRNLRTRVITRSLIALAALVSICGCDGCPPVTIKTIDLSPSSAATGVSGVAGSIGYCLSPGNPPPTSFSPGPGQVMVGFDDYFKHGTDPFPCNDVRAVVFRVGVIFDLSQFDSVASADLLFDTVASVSRSNGETVGQNPAESFATTLGLGTGPFTSAMPDNNEVSLTPTSGSVDIGVSSQVRDWVNKVSPNFGFVLWGPKGPVDPSNPPEDNDAQVSWYANLKLRVVYNPAQNPRAPQ